MLSSMLPSEQATLRLLGGFELMTGPRRVRVGPVSQRVVTFLALYGRRSRPYVAERLWLDVSQGRAAGNLRSALSRMTPEVAGVIETDDGHLALSDAVSIDIVRAEHHAHAVLENHQGTAVAASEFASDLLPGCYEDWVLLERERLRQLFMHALERLGENLLTSGHISAALQAALLAVRHEPLRETPRGLLIRAYLAEGNRVEAIREYRGFAALLEAEMSILPSESLADLVARRR